MGTQHLLIVYYKRKPQICEFGRQGKPHRQGSVILRFLRDAANVQRLRTVFDNAMTMPEQEYKAWLQLNAKTKNEADKNSSRRDELPDYSCIDYGDDSAQVLGRVAEAIEPLEEPDPEELQFLCDSTFCEWAYVIDLDLNTFEVFAEGVKKKSGLDDWRWPGLKDEEGYYERAVDIIGLWDIDSLPANKDFCDHCRSYRKDHVVSFDED